MKILEKLFKNLNFKLFDFLFWVGIFVFLMWGVNTMIFTYPDESRNAYATLFMIKSGEYIVPYYNGEIRYDKPPLLYYIALLIYNLFKIFNIEIEIAFRMVSVIATFLSSLIVFNLSKYFINEKTFQYFAVFLYVSMTNIFIEAKAFVPEPLLSLFINLSLFAFFKIYFDSENSKKDQLKWLFIFWISLGLGILSKGIVSLIVVFLVIIVFLIYQKKVFFFKHLFSNIFAVLLALIIGFSWFILVGIKTNGEFLYNFFWVHNIGRFTGQSKMHINPFYFYIPVIIINFLPIFEVFILFIVSLIETLITTKIKQMVKPLSLENELADKLKFLWIYFLAIFIFYSLSKGKVHHYIMPCFVPLSILATFYLEKIKNGNIKNLENWLLLNLLIPFILLFLKVPYEYENLKYLIILLFFTSIFVYLIVLKFKKELIFVATILKVLAFYSFIIYSIPYIFPNQRDLLNEIKNKHLIMFGDISTISFYNLYINNQQKTQDIWYINDKIFSNSKEIFNKEKEIFNAETLESIKKALKENKEVLIFTSENRFEKLKKVIEFYEFKIEVKKIMVAQSKLLVVKIKR